MSLDDFLDEGPRTDATSPVSAIAAKSADLEAFRKSIEDSAGVSGGLWLSYLFVLFYLGVAAGAVTHADLLLQNPVKLPFLNIELPLLAFFFWHRCFWSSPTPIPWSTLPWWRIEYNASTKSYATSSPPI